MVHSANGTKLHATGANVTSRATSKLWGTRRPFSTTTSPSKQRYSVYIAVGSNMGDCYNNIHTGLAMLCDPDYRPESFLPTHLVKTSFLYQTAPMYVTNQPPFWNGAVQVTTDLDPHALLRRLKWIEQDMGRNVSALSGARNGPRPLDLDILLCYKNEAINETTAEHDDNTSVTLNTKDLTVPHPRIHEREFVLRPLVDVAGRDLSLYPSGVSDASGMPDTTVGDLLDNVMNAYKPEDVKAAAAAAVRILPLSKGRSLRFDSTVVMGILNVTPDSFSDGGLLKTAEGAVDRAMEMIEEGATIIDIGGESTRPGAREISVEEQIRRTVPVIQGIRIRMKDSDGDVILSIDTRNAAVARAAVEAGADIVNDVSGGTFDENMLATVAELNVPMILMHMRGTPESMQQLTDYSEKGGVVDAVIEALKQRSIAAEEAGIPRWMQILDLGIGFAKGLDENLSLLKHYPEIRKRLGDIPLLLGTSRKGFIGKITGETIASERDFGTVSSCVTALCLGNSGTGGRMSLGCNILRVHNVKVAKQAIAVMDAIVDAQ
jgi:dihydropteroate synthase/2-amino-4-hydroxy-6-hydroxymethyldihydropteridine diphosphokinase